MVHWDCDADLVEDHKTSNERLVDIILANEGELLREWLGKGKGDGKKEPMLRTVLKEFHRQKAVHRRTTRDIRNAITQLLKKYQATKQLIQSAEGEADEVIQWNANGIPSYPNGQDKFEASIQAKFPFYFRLQPYLDTVDTLPIQTPPLSPCPKRQEVEQEPIVKRPKRTLKRSPQTEPTLMDLKKRKLELAEQRMLIEHQARAIELFAQHCPQHHIELEKMVKSFSEHAFESIEFK